MNDTLCKHKVCKELIYLISQFSDQIIKKTVQPGWSNPVCEPSSHLKNYNVRRQIWNQDHGISFTTVVNHCNKQCFWAQDYKHYSDFWNWDSLPFPGLHHSPQAILYLLRKQLPDARASINPLKYDSLREWRKGSTRKHPGSSRSNIPGNHRGLRNNLTSSNSNKDAKLF